MTNLERYCVNPPPGFEPEYIAPPCLVDRKWKIKSIALDVSGKCNMACRYCAEQATMPGRKPMGEVILRAAWDLLYPNGQKNQGASVRLGSGEPLLAFPLLEKVAELADGRRRADGDDAPSVFLTTNGTLVDDEKAGWLASSGWNVKVSLDGPESIHDAWRVLNGGGGTFDKASRAVRRLAELCPDRLSVTAVLCRGTNPEEVFNAIAALGVRRIELVPAVHSELLMLPDEGDLERYERFVHRHAMRYLREDAGEIPNLVRFSSRVTRTMGYDNNRIQCGAGRSFVGIGPDGDIFPCFRFIGLEDYRLGNVLTGLDKNASAAFMAGPGRPFDTRTPCRKCWAAPLCGGPCFACAETFGPGWGSPFELQCFYTIADAHAAVWLVDRLRAVNPAGLLSFLPGDYGIL